LGRDLPLAVLAQGKERNGGECLLTHERTGGTIAGIWGPVPASKGRINGCHAGWGSKAGIGPSFLCGERVPGSKGRERTSESG